MNALRLRKIQDLQLQTLARHGLYYLLFCFLLWLAHVIIVSFITFIHLQLGHNFKVIDEWLFQNAWMIITFSTLSGTFVTFKLLSIWSSRRQFFAPFIHQYWNGVSKRLMVVVVFLWATLLFWGKPSFKLEAEFFKNLISALGIFLFYLFNLFIVASLREIFPLSRRENILQSLLFPVAFLLTVSFSFPYRARWGGEVAFFSMFLLFLYSWNGKNWSDPLFFLWAFIVPASICFGIDPLWGASFSFGKLSTPLKGYEWFVLLLISLSYLLFRKYGMTVVNSAIAFIKEARRGISKA